MNSFSLGASPPFAPVYLTPDGLSPKALEALSLAAFGTKPVAPTFTRLGAYCTTLACFGRGQSRRIRIMGGRINRGRVLSSVSELPVFCFEAGLAPSLLAQFCRRATRRGIFIGLCFSSATAYRADPVTAITMALNATGLLNELLIWRIEVALTEALADALLHGTFEVNQDLHSSYDAYLTNAHLLDDRLPNDPFANRSICVFARISAGWLTFEVLNEGSDLNEPLQASNLDTHGNLPSGRNAPVTSVMADRVRRRNGGRRLDLGFALSA